MTTAARWCSSTGRCSSFSATPAHGGTPGSRGWDRTCSAQSFDERLFLRNLRAEDPRRPIGDSLLNQRILAGIGNLWKAEACFAAEVDPWRATSEVDDEQALRIVGFARERMSQSARDGFEARPRAVYRRGGEPAPVRFGSASAARWECTRLTFSGSRVR